MAARFESEWRRQMAPQGKSADTIVAYFRGRLPGGVDAYYMGRFFERAHQTQQLYSVMYLLDRGDRSQTIAASVIGGYDGATYLTAVDGMAHFALIDDVLTWQPHQALGFDDRRKLIGAGTVPTPRGPRRLIMLSSAKDRAFPPLVWAPLWNRHEGRPAVALAADVGRLRTRVLHRRRCPRRARRCSPRSAGRVRMLDAEPQAAQERRTRHALRSSVRLDRPVGRRPHGEDRHDTHR